MAVNRQRGESEVIIGGKTYVTVMDLNAIARLEDHWTGIAGADVTFAEIMAKVEKGSFRHIQTLLWVSLLRYQPDATADDVSTLTLPELFELRAKLADGMTPDKADAKATKARPRKAQVNGVDGTGAISKSSAAPLV
jgi:hypothetical protein